MKRTVFTIYFLLSTCITSFGQIDQPNAPTATVYDYSKYADVRPDLFTGAISESISFGQIIAGPIAHPVGLRYYFAGHRPGVMSGPEGLGWSKIGGGVVTRTIRGLSDFEGNGWLQRGDEFQSSISQAKLNEIANGQLDGEADLYSLQIGDINLKFIMDPDGVCYQIDQSDFEIEYETFVRSLITHHRFILTDTGGTKYYFGNDPNHLDINITETMNWGGKNLYTAWYLVKIETHDQSFKMDFGYQEDSYEYYSLNDCTVSRYQLPDGATGGGYICSMSAQKVEVEGYVLSSITGLNTSAQFTYSNARTDVLVHDFRRGSQLDKVDINNGTYTKSFELGFDYFTDPDINSSNADQRLSLSSSIISTLSKKLRLTSITEKSGTISLPPYEFEYYGPNQTANGSIAYSVISKAYDLYGVANGEKSNNNKNHIIPYTVVEDSRGTITSFGHGGNIRKSSADYGVVSGLSKMTLPTGGKISYQYEGHTIYEEGEVVADVTVSATVTGVLSQATFNVSSYQINNGQLSWTFEPTPNANNATIDVDIIQNGMSIHNATYTTSGQIDLDNLQNTLTPNANATLQIRVFSGTGNASISYPETTTTHFDYGGVRVSKRVTSDGANSVIDIVREFTYDTDCGDGNSSGKIFRRPITAYAYIINNFIFSTASIQPFTSAAGSYLGYQEAQVLLKHGTSTIGTVCNTYYTDNNVNLGDYPPVPEYEERTSWGHLNQSLIYDKDDNRLGGTQRNIGASEESIQLAPRMYVARRHSYRNTTGGTNTYTFSQRYKVEAGTFRPGTIQTYSEALAPVTTSFTYNGNSHLLATSQEINYQNGDIHRTDFTYTFDESTADIAIDALHDRNILSTTITKTYVDNIQTTEQELDFRVVNTHPRPDEVKRTHYDADGDTSLETDEYVSYNSLGLLTQYNAHDLDYNNTFAYDSKGQLTSVGTTGGTNLSKSFAYKPNSTLISSITEVDGTTTTYDYDALMRLNKVTFPTTATREYTYNISSGAGPATNEVYIKDTFPADANELSQLTTLETYQYHDGLGRLVQTVGKEQTFDGTDQVSAQSYDNQGKLHKLYEIYSSGGHDGGYSSTFSNQPYTEYLYEASPLLRPLSVSNPIGHTTTYSYGTSTFTDLIDSDGQIYTDELLRQRVIDGNDNFTDIYTDREGKSLIKRRISEDGLQQIETKYTYDWKDRLIEVIPPGSAQGTAALNFFYEYDSEGKVLRKKVPSKDWIDYRYDIRDLQHGMQDGYLRANNKWYQTSYDIYGRILSTGIHDTEPTNSYTTPDDIRTITGYGTSGTAKGKITSHSALLEGTTQYMATTTTYDAVGRVDMLTYNNVLGRTGTQSTTKYFYDGASNAVMTRDRVYDHNDDLTTIINKSNLDNDGRKIAAYIDLSTSTHDLPERQLCAFTYTPKDQTLTKYQGGNASSHLQKIDYSYLDNGALHMINQGNSSGSDLFGYQINYHQDLTGWNPGTDQYNGNIKSTSWKERGNPYYVQAYHYDYLDRLKAVTTGEKASATTASPTKSGYNNTTYTYDDRGNFNKVTRKQNNELIDNLTYNYDVSNTNQLESITEIGDASVGYLKTNASDYTYDANGNLITDPQKDITLITYNHLDLPIEITWKDGRKMVLTYDGDGTLHRRVLYDTDNQEIHRRDFLGRLEYIDDLPYAVMHGEGRIVNEGLEGYLKYLYLDHQQSTTETFTAQSVESTGLVMDETTMYDASQCIQLNEGFSVESGAEFDATIINLLPYSEAWRYDYDISDHLGNLRMTYTGTSSTNLTVLQSMDYFPYGMQRTKNLKTTLENKYQYNGIDHVGEFGLGWEMATYRSLDASNGRWGQVDPSAESLYSLSPYQSMNNNPISMSDPDGDLPFLAVVGIGALVGTLTNGINNVSSGQGFFQGAGSAALWGAVGGAVSFGIGSAAAGIGSEFGKAAFQMGAHGLTGGIRSDLMGGSFGSGFLSGAISSGMSSGAGAIGIKNLGMVGIGGLSGGIGSAIGGGNFWDGVGQGLLTSGLNHAAHVGASAIEADIHVKAARAFLEDSGYDAGQVAQDVVKQTDGFFGKYYAKLLNHKSYTSGWTSQLDSRTGKTGLVSPALKGYSLKYYHHRQQSIGLIRTGAMHYFEAGMEMMDGAVRSMTRNNELWSQLGYQGGLDNTIYDMHGRNSRGYLRIR